MTRSVVVIEDEFLIAEDFMAMCEDIGLKVLGHAATADEAEALILGTKPDYVLMDVRIQGTRDGVDVAAEVRKTLEQTRIIYITGSNEPKTIKRMKSDRPHAILAKPVSFDAFRDAFN